MTIKQHGGIFGRNPTFNNVTVDGTLTVDQIVEKTGAAGITLDDVTLKDGNVVLADGKGIDFSATSGTGTSELFDDYEEGEWTVGIEDASGNASATTATGYYTKIGNTVRVHFSFITNIDTTGLTSGDIFRITGLPFTVANGVHQGNFYANQLTNNASRVVPFPNAMNNTTYMQVINVGDNVNASYMPVSAISSGATDFAALVLVYETAS